MIDGIRFHSKREARRWQELRLEQLAGGIAGLERQVPYRLEVGGHLIATYRADFRYQRGGCLIVEDSKGFRTPEYRLKKRLMRAIFGVDILET